MMNRDYILRIAEQFGRMLAIVLRLRKFNRHEEALIAIDEYLIKMTGFSSSLINSLSERDLIKALSPLGSLNIEAALWAAVLLKTEGETYEEMGNTTESYYRYVKALHLMLYTLFEEPRSAETELFEDVEALLKKLDEYDIPQETKQLVFRYFEHQGHYSRAEDLLYEMLDAAPNDPIIREEGEQFYQRLLTKTNSDLQAGNLARDEVEEGLQRLRTMQ
ncbi:DUF6483 family protein [Thermosporothrix hazakensis]|jgi:tetratricopeptide (TPR) repeat protein|nr:DUF6483 family protein [Thermosporothrix hazakensis]GCE46743.1 hypothetical protein KTH_16120 [Thermosporothrix hazakensis]